MPSIVNLIAKCVIHNYFQNISGYDIRENVKPQDYIQFSLNSGFFFAPKAIRVAMSLPPRPKHAEKLHAW